MIERVERPGQGRMAHDEPRWGRRASGVPRPGRGVLVALGAVALGAVASHLVLAGHPDWSAPPLALLDDLYILGVGLGLVALLAAAGHRVLVAARVLPAPGAASSGLSRLDRGLVSLTAGWALASLVLALVGLVGLLVPAVLVGLLAAALALAWPSLRAGVTWLAMLPGRRPPGMPGGARRPRSPERGLERLLRTVLVALVALLVGLALVYALAPPAIDDALIYHLAGPAAFLRDGRIEPLPLLRLANMPMSTEMLYLVALAAGSPSSAQVVHWSFAVLTALLLVEFGRWLYPAQPRGGWFAAAFYWLTPLVGLLAGWAFIDLALTFAVTLSLYAACRVIAAASAGDGPEAGARMRPWAVTLGLAGGLAMGAKYTALFPVGLALGGVALVLLATGGRRALPARLQPVVLAAVLLVAVAAPWFGKNWWWFGNPLYPVSVSAVAQSATQPVAVPAPAAAPPPSRGAARLVPAPRYHLGTEHTLAAYLRLPWDVITQHKRFTTTPPALLNPFLALAVLGAWGARRRRWAAALGALALGGFAFWAIGYPDIRYYLPYVPLLCLLGGGGLAGLLAALGSPGGAVPLLRRLARAALLALCVVLAAGQGVVIAGAILLHNQDLNRPVPDGLAVAVGAESRQGYVVRHVSNERAVLYLNSHAAPGDRVLFLWSDRIFWSRPRAIPDQDGSQLALLLAADARARATRRPFALPYGARYLLVSRELILYYRRNGWLLDPGTVANYAAFDALAGRRLTRLYHDPAFDVYRVRAPGGPRGR